MKIINSMMRGGDLMSVVMMSALFVFSILLSVWQMLYNEGSRFVSGIPIYLPLLQAVLLLLVIVFGMIFYRIRHKSIMSQDVMGATDQGINLSFINTENFLGAAAGGIVRFNSLLEVEYINDAALSILGFKGNAVGCTVKELITNYESQKDGFVLRECLAKQFSSLSPSVFEDISLTNLAGDKLHIKLKTAPIQSKQGNVHYVILIIQDLTEEKKKLSQLYRQASVDSLTGLMNRHSFQADLDELLASATGSRHVLAYMDLDHFKVVNDVCGHAAGDMLLKQISGIFSKSVRASDKLARVGGDEFAILLPQCEIDISRRIFNRILEDVNKYRFTWDQNSFSVGVSIGAVEFDARHRVSDRAELMVSVDKACYKAKQNGRNQVFIQGLFESELDDTSKQDENWDQSINNALKKNQFSLYIQPIISLAEESSVDACEQYEVLVRMEHEGELLSPGSFLPSAERLGLMSKIDRWVVSKVVEMVASHNEKKNRLFTINISADTVMDVSFVPFVKSLIDDKNIGASLLCFEISESVALANFVETQSTLQSLADMGCSGSLDDFGSGFSSLNYLRDLSLEYLKIDGSFIRNMSKNRVDAAMVDGVNKVGQVMNLRTVAELVENEITVRLLQKMGVDYAQGYHCGKPFPIEDVLFLEKVA